MAVATQVLSASRRRRRPRARAPSRGGSRRPRAPSTAGRSTASCSCATTSAAPSPSTAPRSPATRSAPSSSRSCSPTSRRRACAWPGAWPFVAVWLARVWLAVRFERFEPRTAAHLARRLRAWHIGVLASGGAVGRGGLVLLGVRHALHQIGLVLVVYTFCVASVPILSPQFRLFVAFVLLVFVPAIAARGDAGPGPRLADGAGDDGGDGA